MRRVAAGGWQGATKEHSRSVLGLRSNAAVPIYEMGFHAEPARFAVRNTDNAGQLL